MLMEIETIITMTEQATLRTGRGYWLLITIIKTKYFNQKELTRVLNSLF